MTKIDPILAAVESGPDQLDVSLDATRLVALDTTGVDALEQLVEALERRGGRLDILHLNEQPRDLLLRSGLAARLRTCC